MPESKKSKPAQVFHFDLYGKREEKYDFLNQQSIGSIPWTELNVKEPYFFFVPKDFEELKQYNGFIGIADLFSKNVSGFQTKRDDLTIQFSEIQLMKILEDFLKLDIETLRVKYSLPEDGRDWKIELAKKDLSENNPIAISVMYRPFDNRFTFFTGKSKGFVAYPRNSTMKHFLKDNLGVIFKRSRLLGGTYFWRHLGITNLMTDLNYLADQSFVFPLYLYPDDEIDGQQTIETTTTRNPNINAEIVNQIAEKLGFLFTKEKDPTPNTFAPIDILDYIYAVLHSPTYREKYKEFLKIDFPRVPYPKDQETFWKLVALGGELRQIHLLESPKVNQFITTYPMTGNNIITKLRFESSESELQQQINKSTHLQIFKFSNQGKVWINDQQYFEGVPLVAWNFYIGGYQPAQKWLKDRKGRELSFEDILHYQKIIVALTETDRLMKEIDNIKCEV